MVVSNIPNLCLVYTSNIYQISQDLGFSYLSVVLFSVLIELRIGYRRTSMFYNSHGDDDMSPSFDAKRSSCGNWSRRSPKDPRTLH